MEVITMKLADLRKPEKNVRIHTEQQLKEFRRSVEMFGQIRPIVVDEKNVILAGNGLYDTLAAMGKDTAEVYRYDNLTENQKKKLMIADNKIFSLGIENLDTLNSFLEELNGDLDIPGFDDIYSRRTHRRHRHIRQMQRMMKNPPRSGGLLSARTAGKRYGCKKVRGQHRCYRSCEDPDQECIPERASGLHVLQRWEGQPVPVTAHNEPDTGRRN